METMECVCEVCGDTYFMLETVPGASLCGDSHCFETWECWLKIRHNSDALLLAGLSNPKVKLPHYEALASLIIAELTERAVLQIEDYCATA